MANKLPDSGPISMLDVYNVLNPPMDPKDCDYYFETGKDFYARIDEIIFENNDDLSQKTFGFGDGVTDLNSAFSYSEITSTPKMIVARNVTDFSGCFYDCTSLTTIPEGLFDNCPNIDDFSNCFFHCYSLTTIPVGLFDSCPNVTSFSSCFNYCSEITSALPDVWNKDKFPKVVIGSNYALNCTKAANYNEIPSNFGGPSTNPPVTLVENTNNTKSLINNIRTANIPTSPISLNDTDFRELAGISNGQISLRDFYGKPQYVSLKVKKIKEAVRIHNLDKVINQRTEEAYTYKCPDNDPDPNTGSTEYYTFSNCLIGDTISITRRPIRPGISATIITLIIDGVEYLPNCQITLNKDTVIDYRI